MESMTLGPLELARVLGFELATLKRLSSQAPGRLPPAIRLGAGQVRSRRVWLRATVEAWLKQREQAGADVMAAPTQIAPVARQERLERAAPAPGKRGRGRPRKNSPLVTGVPG